MAVAPKGIGIAPRPLVTSQSASELSFEDATLAERLPDEVTVGEGRKAAAAALHAKPNMQRTRESGSPLLDAAAQVTTAALRTRIIDEPRALALAERLDRAQEGFETRLVHMQLERAASRSLIGKTGRQRLVTSITAAFGRTGERFSASRSPSVDGLGLPRGDQGFVDVLINALREQQSPRTLETLCGHLRETKTAESLQSGFDALGKIFATGAFSRGDRTKLVAAVLRAQASLKANVIQMSLSGGNQGLFASLPTDKLICISANEKDALLQRIAAADLPGLQRMRLQAMSVLTTSLFPTGEHKTVIANIDSRLMTLRAIA